MYLEIKGRKFEYQEVELYLGRKIINKQLAKENLLLFNSVIKNTQIIHGLFFGTLLGVIREGDFISHDEDIDIYILSEQREDFLELLFEFKSLGFKLARYSPYLLSLIRNDEYIDCYFFEKKHFSVFGNYRYLSREFSIRARYLENPILYPFLGDTFYIPSEPQKVLKSLYGSQWNIPIKDYHAPPNTIRSKIVGFFPFMRKVKKAISRIIPWTESI